jgi:hypothetical protein
MLRRFARPFARLVGLAFTVLGVWILIVNLTEVSYSGWVLAWILSAGFIGAVGGLLFLVGFDGPARLRTHRVRLIGWVGMLVLALLPWSFQFVMLALIALAYPVARQPHPTVRVRPEPSA